MYGCDRWSFNFDRIFFIRKATKCCSKWRKIFQSNLVCLRVQFFGPLFSSGNLEANVKLFTDDTSMFSVVSNPINTSKKLNKNLDKVGLWANKWQISFNPDPSKQAQVVIFFKEDNQSMSIINSKAFGDTSWSRA